MVFDWKVSTFVIEETFSIEDAMTAITANRHGAVVIVNCEGILVGILSDGDIRRALLRGATIRTPVSKVANMNVTTGDSKRENIERLFAEHKAINLIPVVDEQNFLKEVITREAMR